MGYNLTFVCTEHKRQHTSLRGQEGIDFQTLMREGHAHCFRDGKIIAYVDSHAPSEADYPDMYPVWESRPAERIK